MTNLDFLIAKYGTGKPAFVQGQPDLCRLFGIRPEQGGVQGTAKNGIWVFIPKDCTGLHEIKYADSPEELNGSPQK